MDGHGRVRALLSIQERIPQALPWLGYALAVSLLDRGRIELFLVATLASAMAYGGSRGRRLYEGTAPFFLLFVLYDGLRYVTPRSLSEARVIGCGLRDAELAFFGFRAGDLLLTPNEWLARIANPALDLLCALPYGAYLAVMLLQYGYLLFRHPDEARRFARIALGTHLLGFVTYELLPAAPPWYVQEHGCAIDLAVQNTPAASLLRVDAALGLSYFRSLYGHGSVVFGALPSLHVTYPLYGLLVTFRRASLPSRIVQIGYALWMPFAALYLGHHYVIDVLLGVGYTLVVYRYFAFNPTIADPTRSCPAPTEPRPSPDEA